MSVIWASIASLAMAEPMVRRTDLRREPSMSLLKLVEPVYPEEALRLGVRGTVIVELLIDKQGLPQKIQIIKGHSILAAAVNGALHQWQWKPYRLNGEVVEIDMMIAMNFELPQEYAELTPTLQPVQLRN
jgi:TonB family protein